MLLYNEGSDRKTENKKLYSAFKKLYDVFIFYSFRVSVIQKYQAQKHASMPVEEREG